VSVVELIPYTLTVLGSPAPQGSKTAGVNPKTGLVFMRESSKHVKPWRAAVAKAARLAPPEVTFDGPLVARMVFTMRKPDGAPKRRRTYPAVMPDLSKLLRSTEDALTDAGVWADDARVVEYQRLAKVYPGEDPESLPAPGVYIAVWQVDQGDQA
jgi:Holliday junction resolvase RusA-like endonuclease